MTHRNATDPAFAAPREASNDTERGSRSREHRFSDDTTSIAGNGGVSEEAFNPLLVGFAQLVLTDADGQSHPIRFDCPSNPSPESGV